MATAMLLMTVITKIAAGRPMPRWRLPSTRVDRAPLRVGGRPPTPDPPPPQDRTYTSDPGPAATTGSAARLRPPALLYRSGNIACHDLVPHSNGITGFGKVEVDHHQRVAAQRR